MRRRALTPRHLLAAAVVAAFCWQPAVAGLSIEEYLPPQEEGLDEETRLQRMREIEQEREEARRRAEERERQLEEDRRRRQAELEALPPGHRALLEHCVACHEERALRRTGRSRIGWRGVVWRMEMFQGVDLSRDERRLIVRYLAEEHPPTAGRIARETAMAVAAPAAVFGGVAFWLLYRRRSRK